MKVSNNITYNFIQLLSNIVHCLMLPIRIPIRLIFQKLTRFDMALKDTFLKTNRILKSFPISDIENWVVLDNNKDLRASASRVTLPRVFNTYLEYCSNSLGKPINLDLEISVPEVREVDSKMLTSFSTSNFNFSKLNLDLLLRASSITFDELGMNKPLELCSIEESLNSYPSDTSACYPHYGKKSLDVNREYAFNWATDFFERPDVYKLLQMPSTIFHRFRVYLSEDLLSNKVKSRPVWGTSFAISVVEGVYFRKFCNNVVNVCRQPFFVQSALGKRKVDISIDIIDRMRRFRNKIACLDLEKFDSTIPSFMWSLFYSNILHSNPDLAKEHVDNIISLMIYDNYTPYCYGDTMLKFKKKGNNSGGLKTSTFNNFVSRTILNYSILEYTHGKKSAEETCSVLGDDVLISLVYFDLPYLKDVFSRFGMTLNLEKTSVVGYDELIPFAGYIWNKINAPTQTLSWYVSHLCVPSRFLKKEDIPISVMQTYRAISVCCGLYKGMDWFYYLVGSQDFVFLDLLSRFKRGQEPIIQYIGTDSGKNRFTVPLSKIIYSGWEAF